MRNKLSNTPGVLLGCTTNERDNRLGNWKWSPCTPLTCALDLVGSTVRPETLRYRGVAKQRHRHSLCYGSGGLGRGALGLVPDHGAHDLGHAD